MIVVDNKKFIQRFVDETIINKNVDAIDGIVAEHFVEHVPFPGCLIGREGLKYALPPLYLLSRNLSVSNQGRPTPSIDLFMQIRIMGSI